MKNVKRILMILLVNGSFLYAAKPEFEFFGSESQSTLGAGKRSSGEEVPKMERAEGNDSDAVQGGAKKKKKLNVQWVPSGIEGSSDESGPEEDDQVVVEVGETFSREEAQQIREETERVLEEDRKHFGKPATHDVQSEDEEGYTDVSEIEAEYESLVALNYQRLSELKPEEVGRAEEVSIGKMIAYLNIFKGALAQLPETTESSELEERIAFKAKILQVRKALIKLQEDVEKLHRARE